MIAYRDGAPVMLRDVAQVRDSNENIRNAGLYNGKSAVLVIVYPMPGSNVVKTVGQIRARLPIIEAALPSTIHVQCRDRPFAVGARVGGRYRAHAVHRGAAGGGRGVRVPAVAARHADSGGRAAAVDRRHLRADVSARLQHRQPLADGADHRHRLRGRRRGGGAGEHRASSRSRCSSRRKPRCAAAPRSASR